MSDDDFNAPPRFDDLTGKTFGRLTVVCRAENSATGRVRWLCRCWCGKEKICYPENLKRGKTQSCGCFQKDKVSGRAVTAITPQPASSQDQESFWDMANRRLQNLAEMAEYHDTAGNAVSVEPPQKATTTIIDVTPDQAENEVRKDFTPSEKVAIGLAIEQELKEQAKLRQGTRTDLGRDIPVNSPECDPGQESRAIAAKKAGFGSEFTYRQAKVVVTHGTPEPKPVNDTPQVPSNPLVGSLLTETLFNVIDQLILLSSLSSAVFIDLRIKSGLDSSIESCIRALQFETERNLNV